MNQPGSKLDKLGDILGIDDTEELPRPEPRRGVGEVLAGRVPAASSPDNGPQASSPVSPPLQPREPANRPKPELRAPGERVARRGPRQSADVPMHRTTSTVPVEVIARLDEARDRRWTVSRILSSAISQPPPPIDRVEEMLARYDGSPRAVCSYRLPVTAMETLDSLADDWRLSRSQVIGLLLELELERQGF